MTTLTVFELSQLEAEENIWVPTKATKFITRLLSRRHSRSETASDTEGHAMQADNPSEIRMVASLQPASRQHYSTYRNDSSSKVVRAKRNQGNSRSTRTSDKSKTNK